MSIVFRSELSDPMTWEQLDENFRTVESIAVEVTRQVEVASEFSLSSKQSSEAAQQSAADSLQWSIVAQTEAGAFSTTAAGLLKTVSGQLFGVLSSKPGEYLIIYSNVSGSAVDTGKRINSAEYIENIRLTSGNIFKEIATFGQAFNGGVLIVGADGRNIGVKIPAGQTGNTSYVRAELGLKDKIPDLIGTKIQMDVYYDATLNFVNETLMTTLVMQVIRGGSAITVTPETQSLTQTGTVIHKMLTYTIQTGDSDVCPVFRPGASTTGADRQAVISSVSWKLLSQPKGYASWSDFHLNGRLEPLSKKIAANTITSGELMDGNLYSWNGEALGGSIRVNDANGNFIGLSVPSGATGGAAYVSPFIAIDGVSLAGTTLSMVAKFEATPNFTGDCPPGNAVCQVKRGGGSINVAVTNLKLSQDGNVVTKTFDYKVTADDVAISPTYQISSATVAAAYLRSITITSMKFTLPDLTADALLRIQINAATSKLGVRGPEKYVTVAETGGDFTTLAAANAANAGASRANPVTIIMLRDEETFNVMLNDYVSITGGLVKRSIIRCKFPDNVDPALIPTYQTLWANKNHTLRNVHVICENARYPIHSDSGNAFRDGLVTLIDCILEHRGNFGAQAYQDSIKSGIVVWNSYHAWGYGASSGQRIVMKRTKLISPDSAFYVHNNLNFSSPVTIEHDECEFVTTVPTGKAMQIQALGSGKRDSITVRGTSGLGELYVWPNPWFPTTLDRQSADHNEFDITVVGSSPMVYVNADFGRALKIQSATDGLDSKVVVSGDAVPVIFGKESYSLDGCPGIPGYAYGWGDISGEKVGSPTVGNITSLGKRLGNCTAVNKTLNVLIDGATTRTIVFNQDYTNQDNATVLAAINAVLGSLATATAYNIGSRYRPSVLDEEVRAKNNGLPGILMGMATAYDGSIRNIRKMTATDDPSLFAGIALQDFYPAQIDRIKTSGRVKHTDLLGITGTLTFGQPIYIDPAVPGRMTLTPGANVIMRAVSADAVEVAKK